MSASAKKPRFEWLLVAILIAAFVLFLSTPVAKDPPILAMVLGKKAQDVVDQLRVELSIENTVDVVVVPYTPLVFSVEPIDRDKTRFRLSMELRFLMMLDDDELRAALAHELGHVWIYTHMPFLQTERIANDIGMHAVHRVAFERLYTQLWNYERTTGVPLELLLGPASPE
jgi:hypothetical protein